MKKILNLVVNKKWFDMIASGEKTEEYRNIKSYWVNQLVETKCGSSDEYRRAKTNPVFYMLISNTYLKDLFRTKTARFIHFTHVRFFHGYAKNRPCIEKEIVSIKIGKPKKGMCPNEWLDQEFFIIKYK